MAAGDSNQTETCLVQYPQNFSVNKKAISALCTSLLRLIMRYIAKSGLMLRGTDNISLARFISCSRSLQTTKRKLIFATLFWNCCSNSFSVMPHVLRKATGTYIYVTSCFLSSVNATTYTEYKNVSGIRSFSNLPAFCSISSVPAICSTFCYVFFCSLPCGGGLAYLFICHCFAFLSFFCYCSRNIFFVQNLPIDKMFCLCIIAKSFSTLKYLHVDKNTLIYKNVSKY